MVTLYNEVKPDEVLQGGQIIDTSSGSSKDGISSSTEVVTPNQAVVGQPTPAITPSVEIAKPTIIGNQVMIGGSLQSADGSWKLNGDGTKTGFGLTYSQGTATKNLADASTTQNIAHGLGGVPKSFRVNGKGGSCIADAFSPTGSAGVNTSTLDVSSGAYNTFALGAVGIGQYQSGVISADATNIIIVWTKTSVPTGTAQLLWSAEI